MKIAHIAPPWISIPPKNYGGTEIVLYNLIEEQVAQGHDVTLFAPSDAKTSAQLISFFPEALIDSGVPWQAHPKAFYHIYKSVEYIRDHEHDFDVLHTHLSSAADLYTYPFTSQLPVPHLSTLHSRFPFDRIHDWNGDADTFYMEWAANVPFVAISKSARDEVTHPLNFIGIVHHGLPADYFRPVVKEPGDYFAWLGRIVPDKGTHLAIEAAKQAGVKLILAGTIDTYLNSAVEYFEHCIKPQIDGEQIQYIGPANMEQKIELLSHARGFLNPIQWEEPFGMVMIEAMALGCPVISTARGAAPEVIAHRETGFLVHDIDEMVRTIPHIDAIERTAVADYTREHFSIARVVRKYTMMYRKVIATHRATHTFTTPIAVAQKERHSLITPAPFIRRDAPVLVAYQKNQGAIAEAEAEPAP